MTERIVNNMEKENCFIYIKIILSPFYFILSIKLGIALGVPILFLILESHTLTGHKSNIRCIDFHPFGEFVASGSLDTNLKVLYLKRDVSQTALTLIQAPILKIIFTQVFK